MPKMAVRQCVQPGQKSFGHLEILVDYGRHQTESLEYAAPIWDPHTKTYFSSKRFKRRAARWTISNFDHRSSVTAMLQELGWRTLEQRWADMCLCLFYKIIYGLVAVPLPDYIQLLNSNSRHCHSLTFRQIHTCDDFYKYSFYPLTVV